MKSKLSAKIAAFLFATGALAASPPGATAADSSRLSLAGGVALRIDGLDAGGIRDVEGGAPFADVVRERPGPDRIVRKHVGVGKYDDITVSAGLGLSRGFWQWLQETTSGQAARHGGEVVDLDFDYKEKSVLAFSNALVTEIGFPALDAQSKEPASLAIKLKPEFTQRKPGSGASATRPLAAKTKAWLASNFRFVLGDLPTSRVSKIDGFNVKQALADSAVGELREIQREPAALDVSNLVITVPEQDAGPYYDWLDDFVVKGNNGADRERSGTLQFLGADFKQVLFEVGFEGVGITRITRDGGAGAGKEGTIPRVRIELYVERLKLTPPLE